jgi:hypothetical protein
VPNGHLSRPRSAWRAARIVVPTLLVVAGAAITTAYSSQASPPPATPNPNCALAVPPDPLSANGLATPYELSGSGNDGACHEANPNQSAFVEATILDPATGKLAVYRPLVVDRGTRPAAEPVVPTLPANAVVGIWFGFNGNTLTLRGRDGSLRAADCVNGLGRSRFGQFAYCDAEAFFAAVHNGRITIPAIGTARDGLPCPTTRDFGIVDQDQSDNVTTTYLANANGRTAQATTTNAAQLRNAATLANGSDNRLLDAFVDPALGCTPFTAPDLTNHGAPTTSLALNELQATQQKAPVALVPLTDPMTLVAGKPSVAKANLYRQGVGQPPVDRTDDTSAAYCRSLSTVAPQRIDIDKALLRVAPSPDPAVGSNLYDFLVGRWNASMTQLNCDTA